MYVIEEVLGFSLTHILAAMLTCFFYVVMASSLHIDVKGI